MATPQADGSIILNTKVDTAGIKKGIGTIGSIAKTAVKAFAAVAAAAATATVAITKMAVDSYAEYEQLVGGVETLFKDSADKVMAYAENAFATAGVSANEYMSIVTSFSASLLQSLGGDTAAAADVANQALVDMSDNANKMGTSMEMIQNAYQGFAKQNYTMLDNLKLGYGGTRTEMERLLRDAQKLTGVKYDISNLADVYNAIHVIQENLGIAGTTAIEAEKTISGAAKMTKAAWKNVLTAISGGGDLDRALNNLVYSIQKYFENIVPVVERALQGIGELISKIAPMLVKTIVKSLIQAIPDLINAVYQMVLGLISGLSEGINALFSNGAAKTVEKQTNEIQQSVKNQNALKKAVEETNEEQKKSLAGFDELNVLSSNAAGNVENNIDESIVGSGSPIISPELSLEQPKSEAISFSDFFSNLINSLVDLIKLLIPKIAKGIVEALPQIVSAFGTLLAALPEIISSLTDTFPIVFPALIGAVVGLISLLAENIDDIIQPIVDSIPMTLEIITSTLVSNLPTLISSLITIVIAIVRAIPQIISGIVSAIPSVIEMLNTSLLENLPLIIGGILMIVAEIILSLPEILGSLIMSIVNIFIGLWNSITDILGRLGTWVYDNVIKPIADFFDGLWEGIKKGLKAFANFFVDIINGIIGFIETFINFFVKAINWIIDAINKISFDVPSWVPVIGGKKFGFNIKNVDEVKLGRIPRLARGAVIPPNKEFLAVLGDQKHGRNLEAPEDLIRQIVREEAQAPTNFTVKATGSMAQLIRLLNLEITQEQNRASVF